MKTSVFLNGRFIGFYDEGELLAEELRERRRKGEVDYQMNVAFTAKTNELYINTDEGRARRPLIIVREGKPLLQKQHIEKLKSNEMMWGDLVKSGIVEYLDSEEEENCFVALKEEDVSKDHTHLEIDPVFMLGFATSQVPFPEFNSSPRVLLAAQHTKQSLGLFAANFNLRSDTRAHLLFYPQTPLVQSSVYNWMNTQRRASGQNFVVAVLSYRGYNINDAVVLNKSAVERGLGRSCFFRTYTADEHRYAGGQKDVFEKPPEYVQGYLGEEAYAHLGEDGIISPETEVRGDSVLIGRTSPPRFLKELTALEVEAENRREASVTVRSNEKGIVDAVLLSESVGGNRVVSVRCRTLNVPEIGDKFTSRHGQKGVVSLLVESGDMPFTKDGIVPDLIINPHAIPGRMTAGHLLEMLGGKAACFDGEVKVIPHFSKSPQQDYEDALQSAGFKYSGQEVLYDGITGQMMQAKLFVGVIYYQRLHHLVSLKMHARSRGPVQMLTHQPTEGRAREGGLRLGEMERDCIISYGAASLLKERMLDSSDRTVQLICSDCGGMGVFDKVKAKKYCPLCKGNNVEDVEMAYAFKLLLDEIKSIGIFPKLKLKEKG